MATQLLASPATRHLPLQGAENFRDLGGYAAPGGVTAWHKIFCSDSLSALTRSDIVTLADLGLRTVIDLRHRSELARARCVFDGHPAVRYYHRPVVIQAAADIGSAAYLQALDLYEFHRSMLETSGDVIAFVIRLLAHPRSYPLVIHCQLGRDRTGVLSALILDAAGVSRQDIVADFLLSNEYLRERMARWREELAARGLDAAQIEANLVLRDEHVVRLMEVLDRFGGAEGYLRLAGVTSAEIAAFRAQFVA